MQVRDLMNPSVISVTTADSTALAARLLSRHNVGALPVCSQDGRLRGILTDRDIVLRCIAAEEDPAQTPVREIMTRGCFTVGPNDSCQEAARLMAARPAPSASNSIAFSYSIAPVQLFSSISKTPPRSARTLAFLYW